MMIHCPYCNEHPMAMLFGVPYKIIKSFDEPCLEFKKVKKGVVQKEEL